MPDNKKNKESFPTLGEKLSRLQENPEQAAQLKDKAAGLDWGGYSTGDFINDYGQSKYDEPLTEQYFRQTGEGNLGFQEQRAQNQSSLAKLGSGLGNAVTQGTLDILKDASYLLDYRNYVDFKNQAENGFHNALADMIQGAEDKLKLPVYRTEESKGFSPLSAGFWGENMPSIASSLSMMVPATGVVKGIELLKGFEALSGVEGLSKVAKGVTSAIVSRQMEAIMEGGQTYEDTYQTALKELKLKNDPDAEQKAKQIAGEAAANNYKLNWAAIVQDIPQYMVLHKSYKDAASLFTKEAAKEIGKTAFGESVEESYQFMTDKESQRSALINGKVLKDDNTSLADRIIDYSKDSDLWTSAFFGALGGAGFASVGVNSANKNQRQFNDILDAHKAILTGDKEGYYRAQDNLLNSTIVDNAGKNTLDKFKSGLEYIKNNPENIQDQDRAEINKRLDESIAQVNYAQEIHPIIMNDPSIKPEIKETVFASTLAQRMAENKLRDINTKIQNISGIDASNLGFSADIQAYKAAKLKYEGIKNVPILNTQAEELKQTLESVGNEIVNSNDKFKSLADLDKFITSSNDKSLKDLYANQAKYEADLNSTKEILNLASTEEGKVELGKRVAEAKRKAADTKTVINAINNATTEEELDKSLDEADTKGITSPELIDQIAKKREEIQLKQAKEGLTAGLNPNESVAEQSNKSSKAFDSKKSKYYNKSNNGVDDGSKESTERASEFNEKIPFTDLNTVRSRIVTKNNNNPELYAQILEEDPEAKQFEQKYKDKNGEEYQGIYTVIVDNNNQPILKDGKLIASTLETPKRIVDGAIIPDNKQQAIENLNSLREEALANTDPNAYLQPISKSKGEPELLPRVDGERQSIPVEKSFGPIKNIKVEVPISNSKNGFTRLSNGQIALNGKLYAFDKNNTAFDLIPRLVSDEEANMIVDLTDQEIGLKEKTVENPLAEIKKIISTSIPSDGPNEFTYGFKGKTLFVGSGNSFTLEDFKEKPDEIHEFIKDFLTSTKNTNVNVNKKSGYELESPFEGPTTNSENPGKKYDSYKEYLLEGENPMFGTDLAPSTGRQYRNVYLIYETNPADNKVVIKSDSTPQVEETPLFGLTEQEVDNVTEKIKKLPFQKRIKELKNENIITDVYQYGNRPVVVVNIEGIKLPFYRSSFGTGGKTKGKWFPFFGFGKHKKSDTDLTWLIKADTKSNENNFGSKIIKKYSNLINSTLNWDHSLDQSMQNPFFNPEITFKGDEKEFNKRIFGEEDRGIINDGGDSILKAYQIIYDIDPKIKFKTNSGESNDLNRTPLFKINKGSNNIPVEEFTKIADKLKAKTGVNYRILPESEVLNRLKELGVDISIFEGKEAPAFYDGNEIIFPENYLESETALHEYGHFLVGAIQKENPELFENLKKELQDNEVGQQLIDYVKNTYTWLVDESGELVPEGWNEVITQALGKMADGSIKEDTSLWKSLKNMLKWLSEYLHGLFNTEDNVIKPFELNENTSLLDLAKMLNSDAKIEVSNTNESENVDFKIKDKRVNKKSKEESIVNIVNEAYPTDQKLTIDEIREQNKDVSSRTYWTGSLIDQENYLLHSAGYIIRGAQNEIERRTHIIYSEIADKIKEISKTSGKNIQAIYDEIITYDKKTDTKSLIKESELEGKSQAAKDFYKFYQEKIEELAQIVPTYKKRTKDGELIDVPLDKYFIPNVPKSDLTTKLKSLNPIKKRVVKNYTRNQNDRSDTVGLSYVDDIPSKEKSDDLGNNLFMFAKSVYNFDEMNEILPEVRLLQSEVENIEYVQGSDPNTTKSGKESNTYKMLDGVIRAQVKGQRKIPQGKSIVFGTEKNERGEDVQTYLDVTGTIDNLLAYNSLDKLGLSPIAASANVAFGKLSNFIEAIGGQFFNNSDLRKAEKVFWQQVKDKNSVLNKLLSDYNILQELTDYELSENLKAEKLRKLSPEKIQEVLYAPQKYGEKWIQSSTLLAVMIHDGYMNEKGELTEKFNKADKNEKQRLFDKVTGINNKNHGRYSPKEAAVAQQYVLYRLFSQFRKWIPAAVEARFDTKHYDPRLQTEVEGRYNTFYRLVLSKISPLYKEDGKWVLNPKETANGFYNLFVPLFNAKAALEKGNLTKSEIYNMRKMLIESVLAIAFLYLRSIGTGDSDEDKKRRKSPAFKATMLLLNRVSGDLNFFYSPGQINNIGKNAIPLAGTIKSLLDTGPTLIESFDSKKNKFKTGSFKGRYKLPKHLLDLIPGSRVLSDPYKILNKEALTEIK